MIQFQDVSFFYGQEGAGVSGIDLHIHPGEVILLCGESGCGKTTLTRMINGLVPHYYEGTMTGKVIVDGMDVASSSLYDLSGVVGSVFQNPRTQFFTLNSTDEIAFGCENLGMEPSAIRERIDRTAASFQMEQLLDRNLFAMSGGEKQKIACASITAMDPLIYVLDEPSSNLDVRSIRELKSVIGHWKAMGKTVVIAEHRLYYLLDLADRVIYLQNGKIAEHMGIEEFRNKSTDELHSMGLRDNRADMFQRSADPVNLYKAGSVKDFSVVYKTHHERRTGLQIPELTFPKNAIIGILGNNGAGKSTFANHLCGFIKQGTGTLLLDDRKLSKKERLRSCYMVMQDVNHQLFTESVLDEMYLSMSEENKKYAMQLLGKLDLERFADRHPMSLSGGQKQRVAIAGAIAAKKEVLIFDEPTSGLDYQHMKMVAENILELQKIGKSVLIITHDPELLCECCNYFVFMEDGMVQWHGGWTDENRERLVEFFGEGRQRGALKEHLVDDRISNF